MSTALATQKRNLAAQVDRSLEPQTVEPGPMIWTTAQGVKIPITEMKTSHLFNAMKMTFNHLAVENGGAPVWFQHVYGDYLAKATAEPTNLARMVVLMLAEIQRRSDLPDEYQEPLRQIVSQIRGTELLEDGPKQIHE